MLKYLKLFAVSFVFLGLVACGGGVDVSGNWFGTITTDNSPFTMNLTQNSSNVSGTISIGGSQGVLNGTIDGSSLNMLAGGLTITATVSGSSMNGNLSGQSEGVPFNFPFTANKQ